MDWIQGRLEIFAVLLFSMPIECLILMLVGFVVGWIGRSRRVG